MGFYAPPGIPTDGWIAAGETWTYASADDPTFTFTISGDKTTKYQAGHRLKLTQTTAKYFLVTAVSYSNPNTTVTIYGGTDYDLANAAITDPYYSPVKAPFGFPLDPNKWTVTTTDTTQRSQATPVQNTWYNLGSLSIVIPIGVWVTDYQACLQTGDTTDQAWTCAISLSTANNSESDVDFTHRLFGNPTLSVTGGLFRQKLLTLASKTTYYLVERTESTNLDTLFLRSDVSKTIIRATCAYL